MIYIPEDGASIRGLEIYALEAAGRSGPRLNGKDG